jgi:hypothetical protein
MKRLMVVLVSILLLPASVSAQATPDASWDADEVEHAHASLNILWQPNAVPGAGWVLQESRQGIHQLSGLPAASRSYTGPNGASSRVILFSLSDPLYARADDWHVLVEMWADYFGYLRNITDFNSDARTTGIRYRDLPLPEGIIDAHRTQALLDFPSTELTGVCLYYSDASPYRALVPFAAFIETTGDISGHQGVAACDFLVPQLLTFEE